MPVPMSTGRPARTAGATHTLYFSWNAIHFSSGESAASVK
jgi:hypothetical protein